MAQLVCPQFTKLKWQGRMVKVTSSPHAEGTGAQLGETGPSVGVRVPLYALEEAVGTGTRQPWPGISLPLTPLVVLGRWGGWPRVRKST